MLFERYNFILFFILIFGTAAAQKSSISGRIIANGEPLSYASVSILGTNVGATADSIGLYKLENLTVGQYRLQVTFLGFQPVEKLISIEKEYKIEVNFDLTNYSMALDEVVVTGTMKSVSKSASPVSVEVYTPAFFRKNPSPNIYDALQNVNGVRPQLNCQICNTGDIHINGLEGPYTMVLIDGMPIVSSLATVYGLSGIPNSLVERIEIVKGPASSLYGSEAVGGLINIITKSPQNAPTLSADIFATSWGEYNADIGLKSKIGKKISVLTGLNYFNFQNRIDKNQDNFTDVALQNRASVFQKWNFLRKDNRLFSIAGRYLFENRFGGEMQWEDQHRGGDDIYGESIFTNRWEVLGNYQLPTAEKLMFSFSFISHEQDSRYGITSYIASQKIGFSQLTWDKSWKSHELLAGAALRYTFYDDNTPGTSSAGTINQLNQPQKTWLPGIFIQDEIALFKIHKLLLGMRYDYHNQHGHIFTPRLAYKWTIDDKNTVRFNAGTGFRVVSLFTEDHAALTGSRIIEIKNELKPEQSYNVNLNYIKKFFFPSGTLIGLDLSTFYTYFNNRIVGDYELDPNKIIYDNLDGFAESKGISLNVDLALNNGLKFLVGGTFMENTTTENEIITQQILTEKFTGTWSVSHKLGHLLLDYTGNVYSPMRLPLLGELDPRREYSPWWSIQNIQLTFDKIQNIQIYGGIKNLLNWTANRGNPFIIARSFDPFDKSVEFDKQGNVIPTANNPYALTFDPSYVFGPNQGRRLFFGIRYAIK